MRRNIIEGEPGIFPDPVARVLRAVGRVFGRKDRHDRPGPRDDGGGGGRGGGRGRDERSGSADSGSGSGSGSGEMTAEELSDLDRRARPAPGPERPPD